MWNRFSCKLWESFKDFVFRTVIKTRNLSTCQGTCHDTCNILPTNRQHYTFRRVQEYVAAIWWNLALCPKYCKSTWQPVPKYYHRLLNLMQPSKKTVAPTRRNAISAIGNLATIPSNHVHLLSFQDGILVQCLMKTNKEQEDDSDSQRRAMRTLRCLCSDTAGHSLRSRIDFIEFLSSVAQTRCRSRHVSTSSGVYGVYSS